MGIGEIDDDAHGITTPRIFTPPLRELTPATSNGYAVIEFAEKFLHVHLYPWQKWLLIHGLELLPDGSYRFRRVVTEVARQNGKTTVMSVLCAWWLFVDSTRHPELSPAWKFLVVGAAQTLDNARAPYQAVLNWCNPNPASEGEAALAVPVLQKRVQRVNNSHGEEAIICRNKAQYIVREEHPFQERQPRRVRRVARAAHRRWLECGIADHEGHLVQPVVGHLERRRLSQRRAAPSRRRRARPGGFVERFG